MSTMEELRQLNKQGFDTFIYIMMCILSFGMVYLIRIVITTAIKKARMV